MWEWIRSKGRLLLIHSFSSALGIVKTFYKGWMRTSLIIYTHPCHLGQAVGSCMFEVLFLLGNFFRSLVSHSR